MGKSIVRVGFEASGGSPETFKRILFGPDRPIISYKVTQTASRSSEPKSFKANLQSGLDLLALPK